MSNLYVKLRTGFYSHRKTAKLRAVIGDDAFWVPPRLWAYAAESQPDGNMSSYASEELAMLLGCNKYATSIKQALLDAGFLDGDGMIHDWCDHAGYHQKYAKRAREAAMKRWADHKKEKDQKKEVHKREESGKADAQSTALALLEASFPGNLRNSEFGAAWTSWVAHRREIRKKLTPTSTREQLVKLSEMGSDRAVATIRHSIANGWQGLFEPEARNGHPKQEVIPLWRQIQIVQQEIDEHPANPDFIRHKHSAVTPAMIDALRQKRAKLAELRQKESASIL